MRPEFDTVADADRRVRKLLGLVDEDAAKTVGQLAGFLEVSPSRLEHLFKSATGRSLREFLTARRLDKAASLLVDTQLSVKQVAFAVGYSYPSSLTRAFVRRFGIAPLPYRRRFC